MSVTDKLRESLANVEAFSSIVEEQVAAQKAVEAAIARDAAARAAQAAQEATRLTRFGSIVEAACLIAAADGDVSADETGHVVDKLVSLTNNAVSKQQVSDMVKNTVAWAKTADRDASFARIATILPSKEERETAFTVAAHAAWTGGGIGVKEGLALQAIARAFGWEIPYMHKLLGKARG
jgi:tellurite resistance protein